MYNGKTFEEDLRHLINLHSAENPSGTPDHILADYLTQQLSTFNETVGKRAEWRGELIQLPTFTETADGVSIEDVDEPESQEPIPVILTNDVRHDLQDLAKRITKSHPNHTVVIGIEIREK